MPETPRDRSAIHLIVSILSILAAIGAPILGHYLTAKPDLFASVSTGPVVAPIKVPAPDSKFTELESYYIVEIENTGEAPASNVRVRMPYAKQASVAPNGKKIKRRWTLGKDELVRVGDMSPGDTRLINAWSVHEEWMLAKSTVEVFHDGGKVEAARLVCVPESYKVYKTIVNVLAFLLGAFGVGLFWGWIISD